MNEFDNKKELQDKIPDYPQEYNCEPIDSSPTQTMAILSFVASIIGILLCWKWFGIVFSLTAIILGIISVRNKETRGIAVFGIIIGIISFIISLVLTIIKLFAFFQTLQTII